MSFEQALSGLNVASQNLDIIGNNVSNANTVGFKTGEGHFSDVFANALGGGGASQVGIGTQMESVVQKFSQGPLRTTSNPLDVAINGAGFFRMLNQNGSISYSRNGQFHIDKDNSLVDSSGLKLTGYGLDANGNPITSNLIPLQLPQGNMAPKLTSNINVNTNLDSGSNDLNTLYQNYAANYPGATATTPAAGPAQALNPFDPANPASFNASTSSSVFDSLGNEHVLSLYYVRNATTTTGSGATDNTWQVYGALDGNALTTPVTPPVPPAAGVTYPSTTPLLLGTLNFDTMGALDAANSTIKMNIPLTFSNGANPTQTVVLDQTGSTQFGSAFGVNSMTQDGNATGRLTGFSIGADGFIQGQYTNGLTKPLAQMALANFVNPNGLQPMGNNQYAETSNSGNPLLGSPGTSSLGVLQASAVEDSNVDLTAELVDMITAQRIYQANAQSIKTQDQIMQTMVNLR